MWCCPTEELTGANRMSIPEQGMYLFGGLSEKGKPTDDLYWIKYDLNYNLKCLSPITGEYKNNMKPEIRLLAQKMYPNGRAPIARS